MHISAACASRQTGCERGSPSTRRFMRSRSAVLVLGMERGAAADRLEDRAHALVVLDQQRAGRRAHEHLDAGSARQPLELAQIAGVLARARRHRRRSRNACGDAPRLTLSASASARGGERIGVRHFEHGGDAAQHRAARAGFQVLLVGQAGLAEMHLAVDHARQQMQAAAVDRLAGARRAKDRRSRRCGRRGCRCRARPRRRD